MLSPLQWTLLLLVLIKGSLAFPPSPLPPLLGEDKIRKAFNRNGRERETKARTNVPKIHRYIGATKVLFKVVDFHSWVADILRNDRGEGKKVLELGDRGGGGGRGGGRGSGE